MSIRGNIVDTFKTSSKWFNPDWWYKKTAEGKNYPKELYFVTEGQPKLDFDNTDLNHYERWCEKIEKFIVDKTRPVKNILKAILKEVNEKTGKNYELDFENTDYGEYWYEAYVPVKLGDRCYIVTWQNCD